MINQDQDYDVVVVGAGGSGLAAAVSAAEEGARVVVLEKQLQPRGTTGIAVGSFTANRTVLQQGAGIEDTLASHNEDVAKFAPGEIEIHNNNDLRCYFLEHVGATLDWLCDMGLVFQGPVQEPPNSVPRMHNVVPGARAYISTLVTRLKKLGGELVCGAEVQNLRRSSGGRVVGVVAKIHGEMVEVQSRRGVVLAAGDYASSRELIEKHKGHRFGQIEGINPYATGDGQKMVELAGGELVNMGITYGPELRFVAPKKKSWLDRVPHTGWGGRLVKAWMPLVPQRILQAVSQRIVVTWQHPEVALFQDGAMLLNSSGDRFCNETQSPEREIAVSHQKDKCGFILLDQRLMDRYSRWPHFISTAPKIAYAYVQDYLRLRPDLVCVGSLSAVAKRLGARQGTLEQTIEKSRLCGEKWLLLGPAKAYFTTTEGGARIDRRFQVLRDSGEPISGLYAVGQNGLGGQILWGHGLHIGWAMTSGRLVGKELAREEKGSL